MRFSRVGFFFRLRSRRAAAVVWGPQAGDSAAKKKAGAEEGRPRATGASFRDGLGRGLKRQGEKIRFHRARDNCDARALGKESPALRGRMSKAGRWGRGRRIICFAPAVRRPGACFEKKKQKERPDVGQMSPTLQTRLSDVSLSWPACGLAAARDARSRRGEGGTELSNLIARFDFAVGPCVDQSF